MRERDHESLSLLMPFGRDSFIHSLFIHPLTIAIFFFFVKQCSNPNITIETMEIILEMYPDGLEEQDKSGRLPFHIAVAHQTRKKFLQYLIDQYPESIKERTKFGVSTQEQEQHQKSFAWTCDMGCS